MHFNFSPPPIIIIIVISLAAQVLCLCSYSFCCSLILHHPHRIDQRIGSPSNHILQLPSGFLIIIEILMAEGRYSFLGQDQRKTDESIGDHHEHDDRSSCGSSNNVREQDQLMPVANVMRIMRKVLPAHAKVADDAKETIQDCVSEFISFITSEANERCQREQRKTITADDLLWAMSKLGLDEYIEPLSIFLRKYRELEGDQRGSFRGELLPPLKKETTQAPFALPANYSHPFSLVPSFSNYPATQYLGAFYNNNGLTNGFYRDVANGASVSSACFDPFAHLKF